MKGGRGEVVRVRTWLMWWVRRVVRLRAGARLRRRGVLVIGPFRKKKRKVGEADPDMYKLGMISSIAWSSLLIVVC